VTFPLYLIARERRLAATGDDLPATGGRQGRAGGGRRWIAAFTVWVDMG
jgi:hypothetical protein